MKKEFFCAVCGDEQVFHENLCKVCYSNDHPLFLEKPESIELKFCRDCNSINTGHRWLETIPQNPRSEPIMSTIMQKFWKIAKVTPITSTVSIEKIDIMEDSNYEQPNSYHVLFRLEGSTEQNKIWDVTHSCIFIIDWSLCETCIAIRNRKYKAVLQIRGSREIELDVLDQLITQLTNEAQKSGDRFAYIVGYDPVRNGYDYYIGSSTLAQTIATKLANKYVAEIKITQECVGWDRMKNRSRYRDVIMTRFPPFAVGDFVQINGEDIWQIISIGSGKIEFYNYSRKTRGTISSTDIPRLRFVTLAVFSTLSQFQIVAIESDAVLLMHMQSYETKYFPRENISANLSEGDTLMGLELDDLLLISKIQ
ncbi:MAG: NMD3-related protein [Candidatus Hodarchaeota archaeon]